MEYPAAKLYRALIYAATLALLAAAWVHTPATALLLTPVIAYLLLVFGMTRLITLAVDARTRHNRLDDGARHPPQAHQPPAPS